MPNNTTIYTNNQYYQDIAGAIRSKNGTANTYKPNEMAQAILDIPTSGIILKKFVIRPDAELVKTWSYDTWAVADEGLTIPAYSTTAQTVKASEAFAETYTADFTNYNYYILERFLTIPTYSITTKAKGRVEYHIGSCAYEIAEIPANTAHALLEPTRFAAASRGVYAAGAFYRSVYYSSGTAVTAYSTSAYSTSQIVVAPTLSSSTITINTPTWSMRGSTSYFTNTYFNAITDIRYQFIAELYRVPKSTGPFDGWCIGNQAVHAVECAQSSTQKLT